MAEKLKNRTGFSLVELCIAMALMGIVVAIAVGAIKLTSSAFTSAERELQVVGEDTDFAAKLNETIRETGVGFTVPKNSFTEENLTAGWDYLGLMDDVHIPVYASRTGHEIDSAQAMVYIRYLGDVPPANVPLDSNLIYTADGYFLQTVLGHSYTDQAGNTHSYSIVFTPTDPLNNAAQSINYEFYSEVTNKSGNKVGSDRDVDIGSMLNSLNAVQVIYQGSSTNPATAFAFRSDFLPTYSTSMINTNKPAATVTLVLDISGSMDEYISGHKTRLQALKESAMDFISGLSANDKINICIIPFSSYAACEIDFNGSVPSQFVFNACNEADKISDFIDSLISNGGTNVGDGLRYAYNQLKALEASGTEMGMNFLVLMTDGAMNAWSVTGDSPSDVLSFYTGSNRRPPYVAYNNNSRDIYIESGNWFSTNNTISHQKSTSYIFSSVEDAFNRGARQYMRNWAGKIVNDYQSTTYLISLCDGMSTNDRAALQDAFGTDTIFDVNSLTDFQTTFQQINDNINNVLWAFTGPRI